MSFIENDLRRKIALFLLVSFTVYWFANGVLWIPWIINKWLGIGVMVTLVPFLWGYSSLYCLKYSSLNKRKRDKWLIVSVFLLISILSDYFFFAIWRGIPDQLYHPTTFAAYGLILVMPLIVSRFKSKEEKPPIILNKDLIKTGMLGIIFFIITLYSVRYW